MRCRIKDADESLPLDAFCIMTDETQADSAEATDLLRHRPVARNPSVRHRLEDIKSQRSNNEGNIQETLPVSCHI